jgi:hypothetical protein
VGTKAVPRPISRVLKSLRLSPKRLLVVGDANSVSEKVRKRLRIPSANRLTGSKKNASDRYRVACAIANKAIAKHWCSARTVAVASEPLEAIAGGAASGDAGGVLVLGEPFMYDDSLGVAGQWVRAHRGSIRDFWLVGWTVYESESLWEDIIPDSTWLGGVPGILYAVGNPTAETRALAMRPAAGSSMRDLVASALARRQLSATARSRWRAAAATLGVR